MRNIFYWIIMKRNTDLLLGVQCSRVPTPLLCSVIPLLRAFKRSWIQDPEKIFVNPSIRTSSLKGDWWARKDSGTSGSDCIMHVSIILLMRSKPEYWSDCPLRRQPTATRSNMQRETVSLFTNNFCIVVWKIQRKGLNWNTLFSICPQIGEEKYAKHFGFWISRITNQFEGNFGSNIPSLGGM